jgi:catechol 2,3-dioxygenase-like lactoylglutathione lyase family enzyme
MRFVAIDHVQLAMPRDGEARARVFYRDVLGLAELPKPELLAGRGGAWFAGGGVQLHLGVEDDFRPARKAHPAIEVDDLGALARALTAAGCPVRPGETLDDRERLFTDDPFGNRLEFLQRLPPPPR